MFDAQERFREALQDDRELRRSAMQPLVLAAGEVLFQRGDPGDAFYILQQGEIRIVTTDAAGQAIVLNVLTAGEGFGELALVDGQPRSAGAIAATECHLLCLRREGFLQHLHTSPLLNQWTIQLLSDRARHMTEFVERLGFWLHQVVAGEYQGAIAALDQLQARAGDRALVSAAASLQSAIGAIRQREERLRREIRALRLEIDEAECEQQIAAIVTTDYFQALLRFAQQLRERALEEV